MDMITVSTADLKARLGRFLALVQQGETIEVTSYRHPVAHIVSVASGDDALITPPDTAKPNASELTGVTPTREIDVVATLIADRSRR